MIYIENHIKTRYLNYSKTKLTVFTERKIKREIEDEKGKEFMNRKEKTKKK